MIKNEIIIFFLEIVVNLIIGHNLITGSFQTERRINCKAKSGENVNCELDKVEHETIFVLNTSLTQRLHS